MKTKLSIKINDINLHLLAFYSVLIFIPIILTSSIISLIKNNEQPYPKKLLVDYYNQALHLNYAEYLDSMGEYNKARNELLIAYNLDKKFDKERNERSISLNAFLDMYDKKTRIYKEIGYWINITEKYPLYRDGYTFLALNYHQLNKQTQALINLNKAKELDPNNATVKALDKLITTFRY